MQQATLEQWRQLYKEADELKKKKPWMIFEDIDLIAVQLEGKREPYFCSIMGRQGNCPGITMYYGMDGYSDLCMIMDSYQYSAPTTYIMGDITCMTCYYGDVSEIEPEQRKLIQDLGLHYKGTNDWTYFYSFEPRYVPVSLNRDEVVQCTKIMEILNKAVDMVMEDQECLPDFENGELLMAGWDSDQEGEEPSLTIYPLPVPNTLPRFPTIKVEDSVLEEYKEYERSDMELVMDLNYLFTPIDDPDYDRPINPLLVLAYDLKEDFILAGDVLTLDHDEMETVVSIFFHIIEKYGIPKKLYARNPRILIGMEYLCEQLQIEIINDPLQELDDIYQDIQQTI
ncbi:DUF6930 domain-containing protein [Faecalicoccus pleomorphus]|uniref:DUF7309 domain-containing protein n=1 Tax=Faecalicoccus pleomorphus TaxID=1323 RepID=UPI0022E949A8|nr:hypothetical protein [Faecalicoccus pleomorphus]